MNFKEFITESEESMPDMPGMDSDTRQKLNLLLLVELEKPVLTMEAGISKIRKVLYLEGIAFESRVSSFESSYPRADLEYATM